MATEEQKSKTITRECPGVSLRVTELQVHDGFLYYVIVYNNGSLNANLMTQLNKVKLKRVL